MVGLWFFNELKKSPNGENSPQKKNAAKTIGKTNLIWNWTNFKTWILKF
jgi:hypothetical protein